jgi:hypothetical protein
MVGKQAMLLSEEGELIGYDGSEDLPHHVYECNGSVGFRDIICWFSWFLQNNCGEGFPGSIV